MFVVRKIASEERFKALRSEWNRLLALSRSNSVFLTWEWLYTWWRHFNARKELFVLEVRDETQNLVGIAPLLRKETKILGIIKIKILHFLGSEIGGSDFLDFILLADKEVEIFRAIREFLEKHGHQWDGMLLTDVLDSSPTVKWLERVAKKGKHYLNKELHEICPCIELPGNYESFLHQLGWRTRRNIRNFTRRLENDYGVKILKWNHRQNVNGLMEEMFRLHRQRHRAKGEYTLFQEDRFRNFHQEVARLFSELDWLQAYCLMNQEGVPVAILYLFCYNQQLWLYQGGFDPRFAPKSLSLILVLMGRCVQEAIAQKLKVIHLLHGQTRFKSSLTSRQLQTVKIAIARNHRMKLYILYNRFLSVAITLTKKVLPKRWRQFGRAISKRKKMMG